MKGFLFFLILSFPPLLFPGDMAQLHLRGYVPYSTSFTDWSDSFSFYGNGKAPFKINLYKSNGRSPASLSSDEVTSIKKSDLEKEGVSLIQLEAP